jgi:hypothetical protein
LPELSLAFLINDRVCGALLFVAASFLIPKVVPSRVG